MTFDLKDLGWDDDWAKAFAPYAADGLGARRASPSNSTTSTGSTPSRVSCRRSTPAGCATEAESLSAVGDWVAVRPTPGEATGTIEAVLPRRSKFSRKVAGEPTEEQIVAANIDTVFLVMGLDGDYNPRRLERYLLLAYESGARPVVILNKSDVADHLLKTWTRSRAWRLGSRCTPISAKERQRHRRHRAATWAGQDRRPAGLLGRRQVHPGQRAARRGDAQDQGRARARFTRPSHHQASPPDPAARAAAAC